jgi:hypothetical protein
MNKSIAVATILMAASAGQAFAATRIPIPGCSYQIMCIINGVAYSPNTPKGYSCNDGYAASVKVCARGPSNAPLRRVSKLHPRPVHGIGSTHNPIVAKEPIIERHGGGGGGGGGRR